LRFIDDPLHRTGAFYASLAECWPLTRAELGGVTFDVMESEMSIVGKVIKQKYYATIRKGYALCFVVSFTNQDEQATLQRILETATFN
jgi:hypothetical protein